MLIFITRKVGNNNMAKVQVVKSKKIQPTNAFDKSPEERQKWAIKNKDKLMNPVPLGIVCGLFFGKQIGVFLFSYLSIKFKIAEMPSNSNWIKFYGVGVLTGIGFTMSLFVGNLAFVENNQYIDGVKIGVLTGSLLSTFAGYFLLLLVTTKKK